MHHTRDGINIYNHTPVKRTTFLASHQQAADELKGDHLGGAGEEGWGEVLGGAVGSGGRGCCGGHWASDHPHR